MTSNALLNRLRHAAGTKKIGHAGTLDPLAEGVLVVGVGRDATKQLFQEVAKEKEYTAVIRFGMTSATDDEEGEKSESTYDTMPSRSEIQNVLQSFIGEIEQIPPIYSAVKIRGREAYKRARSGELFELKSRHVIIKAIDVISYEWPHLVLRVVTGPGVYIRSLARDIGEKLGVGGYLSQLVRTRVGHWRAEDALSLDEAMRRVVE